VNYEVKKPKDGRIEYHIKTGYKGAVLGTKYTATVIVTVDTSNDKKWEVLRIDYDDNNKTPHNRKNIEAMVGKMND